MTPATLLILGIIDKSLQLLIEVIRSMPEDQKRAAWAEHQKRVDFLEGLFRKLTPEGKPVGPVT